MQLFYPLAIAVALRSVGCCLAQSPLFMVAAVLTAKNFSGGAQIQSLDVALGIFNMARFWNHSMYFLLLFSAKSNQGRSALALNLQLLLSNQCWIARMVYDTTINVLSLTMASMAIDRIVATVAMKYYESKESNYFAISLVLVQWLVSVLVASGLVAYDVVSTGRWNSEEIVLSCSLILEHPVVLNFVFLHLVIGVVGFTMLLLFLYYYNTKEYRKVGAGGLSVRYQLAENITTLRFLIPIVVCFGVLYAFAFGIVTFIAGQVQKQSEVTTELITKLWIPEKMYNFLGSIFTFLFCVLCVCLHAPLRTSLKEDILRVLRRSSKEYDRQEGSAGNVRTINGTQLTFANEGDIYFNSLKSNWNM
ncbi:unnamed protein product [Toxocara canis]|uniref:G protein-coupled receptor n=1 Tax=Toxocara canis TaxID=6265 RepID=A0A183TVJ5_TOXCA|nr:unnamed protein product [Toxocara canis]